MMPNTDSSLLSPGRKLFLLGFFTLFLELVLIRYLSGNVWNLGYFPNLVLIGVFIGMGCGFVFHHFMGETRSRLAIVSVPLVLTFLAIFIQIFKPYVPGFGQGGGDFGGELFFTDNSRPRRFGGVFTLGICFLGVVVAFAMISQYTAKFFARLEPLRAYTLDIAGSCCGILCFMAISWFQIPATVWMLALSVLLWVILHPLDKKERLKIAGSFAVLLLLVLQQDTGVLTRGFKKKEVEIAWSPYQKVQYTKFPQGRLAIFVNGILHQDLFEAGTLKTLFYQAPYNARKARPELPPIKRVLIIGAGSGNDVATALANGVEHVDAVEIDPAIAAVGKKHHPAQPYNDPRVNLIIDDGRVVLTRSKEKYDLIIFALTDSLVKVSPMAQIRLENYLFTENSLRRAFSLLSSQGNLVLYNYYRENWLIDKLRAMMLAATGVSPGVIYDQDHFAVLEVSRSPESAAAPVSLVPVSLNQSAIPTDDWPFLYLKERAIPSFYVYAMFVLAALVALVSLVFGKMSGTLRETSETRADGWVKAAFLFMGVAFMLLESKSVIQFALLFGTTWVNSSLVFLAVLLSVLAANYVARWIKSEKAVWPILVLLVGSCLITLVYPLSSLLYFDNRLVRFLLASLMTFSPVFFANLVFSLSFRTQKFAEHVFGWNLMGATFGGVIEYFSMAMGYNALSLIVAGCYLVTGLALLMRNLQSKEAEPVVFAGAE